MAGNQLGPAALGTISLLIPFTFVYNALGALYEVSCTVVCSKYLSSNDYDGAKKMVSAVYISNLFFCVLIGIVGFIFMDNILRAVNIPRETYGEALRNMDFLGLKMVAGAVKKMEYCETFGINNLTITI